MKRHLIFLLFLGIPLWINAQTGLVTVSSEREANKQVVISANNRSTIPHSVILKFSNLSNTSSVNEEVEYPVLVESGSRRLMTLKPMDSNVGIGYRYSILIWKGNVVAEPDTNYVYLFPVMPGKKVKISPTTSMEKILGQKKSFHMTGLAFKTQEGDTIVASRGGVVIDMKDDVASVGENKAYNSSENYVEIYHKDGTIANYKLFKNQGIFVQPGDRVIPGQPLGIIGGANYSNGSHLRFRVSSVYHCEYKSIFPCFYLSEGQTDRPNFKMTYVSDHPQELIMKEMGKKEKKKYLEKK